MTLTVTPGQTLVRVLPAGLFNAPRGAMQGGEGPWFIDAVGAAKLIEGARLRGLDIPFDFEHQTLLSKENGKPAPAAGWMQPSSLIWVAAGPKPGLYGEVKWVGDAAAMIARGEYRYLSPVFQFNHTSREVTDLLHVALTNVPALSGHEELPLAAASAPQYRQVEDSGIYRPYEDSRPMMTRAEFDASFQGESDRSRETFLAAFGELLGVSGR
jgi:phage I-like protein